MSSPLPLLSADSTSLPNQNNSNGDTNNLLTNSNLTSNKSHHHLTNSSAVVVPSASSSTAVLLQDEGLRALLIQEGIQLNHNNHSVVVAANQKVPLSHRNQSTTSFPPTPKSSNQSFPIMVMNKNNAEIPSSSFSQHQHQQLPILNPIANTISSTNNVMVAVRIRPLSTSEKQIDSRVCVEVRGEHAVRVPNFMMMMHKKKLKTNHDDTTKKLAREQQQQEENNNHNNDDNADGESATTSTTEEEHATTTAIKIHSQVMLTCLSGAPIPASSSSLTNLDQQQQQQIVNNDQKRYNFGFQAVFGENSKQSEVYNAVAHPVVESVLSGYNGCIFAFGQTGAGKSFTVVGELPPPPAPNPTTAKKLLVESNKNEDIVASDSTNNNADAVTIMRGSAQQLKSRNDQSSSLQQQQQLHVEASNTEKKNNNNKPTEDLRGIIPRAAHHIFSALHQMYPCSSKHETEEDHREKNTHHQHHHNNFEVTLNFTEIYLEKVRDLLEPQRSNLPIRERDGLFYVDKCSEHRVDSASGILKLLDRGTKNRATSASKMNDKSSRSHSILTISIRRRLSEGHVSYSRLQLVDLAGSERVGKSGTQAASVQFEEACSINKSLTHLSEVITAILENRSHIPYRSSALTRLLSASLGGNSKTAVIVCCSPSTYNEQETLSSLRFGSSVSGIKNRATMNRLVTEEQMRKYVAKLWSVVKILEKDNELLRNQLQVAAQASADPEALGHLFQIMAENTNNHQHQNHNNNTSGNFIDNNFSFGIPSPMTLMNQTAISNNNNNNNNNSRRNSNTLNIISSATITPNSLALQFVQQIARYGRPMSTQTVTSTSGRAENVYSAFNNNGYSNNNNRSHKNNTSNNNNKSNRSNLEDDFDGADDDEEHERTDDHHHDNESSTDNKKISPSPEMMMQSIFGPRSQSPAAQSFGSDMQILLAKNARLLKERSKSQQQSDEIGQGKVNNNNKKRKSEKKGVDDHHDLASPLIPEGSGKQNRLSFDSSGSVPSKNRRGNGNDDDDDDESAAAAADDDDDDAANVEPATSREFSPSPPALPKHLHHSQKPNDTEHHSESSSSSSSSSSSNHDNENDGDQQQQQGKKNKKRHQHEQQQIDIEDQLQYVSILKDLSEALQEVEFETADADQMLKQIQEQKLRDKKILIEKEQEFEWLQREREMTEKLRESERIREALQMNLSMMHFSIKESERSRVKGLQLLEDQSMQFSRLVAELDKAKTRAREAEESCEELKRKMMNYNNNNNNNVSNYNSIITSSSSSLPVSPVIPATTATTTKSRLPQRTTSTSSSGYDQKSQTEIHISDFRENDPLASFTVAPVKFEDLVVPVVNSPPNSSQNNSNQHNNDNSFKPNSNKNSAAAAADAFLDRALTAEKLLADANASITKLRQDKDQSDSECSALKRQIAVMEQRLIALRRITDNNNSNVNEILGSPLSNNNNDSANTTMMTNNDFDDSPNNNNSTQHHDPNSAMNSSSMMSAQRLAALKAARANRGNTNNGSNIAVTSSPNQQQQSDEGIKNLQERTKSMASAAERLQQETKKFDTK